MYIIYFLRAFYSSYLFRRIVFNAQKNGYRIAVLNHIGTLATVPVTSPRSQFRLFYSIIVDRTDDCPPPPPHDRPMDVQRTDKPTEKLKSH